MSSIKLFTKFPGGCIVFNMGMLIVATIFLILMRGPILKIHSELFELEKVDLSHAYFQYLAQYKIVVFVLNLVPCITLKIID